VTTRLIKKCFLFLVIVSIFCGPAWAISPPERDSGGRFFPSKGTRASDRIYESNYLSSGYARTEAGRFERENFADGLKFGALRVRPSVGYTGEYDSNIFLTENDAKGDYISRLLGGIDAYLPMKDGKYLLMAGVQSKSEWFAKNSNANHTDWAYQAGGQINFSAFQLAVHEDFRDTTDRSDSELTDRIKRFENRLSGLLTVPFGKFFSETEVTHFIVDFRDDNEFRDRKELSFYPRLGVDIGSKTQALIEYGFTDISYDNNAGRDGTVHQAQLGIRGYLGRGHLLAYQLWAGWQFRDYDSDRFKGYNGVIGHGELVYRPSGLTQVSLRALRRPQESTAFGQSFYTRNELSLQYKRQLARNWFGHIRGSTGLSDYSNDRLDFMWEPAVGVEYLLPGRRFALFTEYRFSARESDRNNNDFNRHIAQFGIKAQA